MSAIEKIKEEESGLVSVGVNNIPDYLYRTYYWAYLDPKNVKRLDVEWIVSCILWGNHRKLYSAVIDELSPGQQTLQTACVYGKFSKTIAEHIGERGQYDIIDIAPIQVKRCRNKLKGYKHVNCYLADATQNFNQHYDSIICYFLLHEVPDLYKQKIVNNLLAHLKPSGKLIVVDYHKPHRMHPIKPITSFVFNKLEPFAKSLWLRQIEELVENPQNIKIRKQAYFGGMFQKVVFENTRS